MRVPAATQTKTNSEIIEELDKRDLWVKNCKDLSVAVFVKDNSKLGITKEEIRTKVELRLRQANIRPREDMGSSEKMYDIPSLQVSVITVDSAFNVDIDFVRYVTWALPNGEITGYWHPTWKNGWTGIHLHDRAYLLSQIDDLMDSFLNAYLKANQ